jgi:hypothetical protein
VLTLPRVRWTSTLSSDLSGVLTSLHLDEQQAAAVLTQNQLDPTVAVLVVGNWGEKIPRCSFGE